MTGNPNPEKSFDQPYKYIIEIFSFESLKYNRDYIWIKDVIALIIIIYLYYNLPVYDMEENAILSKSGIVLRCRSIFTMKGR